MLWPRLFDLNNSEGLTPFLFHMENSQRILLCNSALEACKQLISADVYSEIHDYINEHSEWGLGIETLIDALCEEEAEIRIKQFKEIQMAMESMGLDQNDRVKMLERQITAA